MRVALLTCVAMAACNSGDLLGSHDAGAEAAVTDAAIDATDDVAQTVDAAVDSPSIVDVAIDTGAFDAEAASPPLWWYETTSGALVASMALDSSLDVVVGGGAPFLFEKYDAIGNPLWKVNAYQQSGSSAVTAVAVDSSGAMIAAAYLDGTVDVGGGNISATSGVFFVKYDAAGNFQWQVGPFAATISSIAIDSQSRIVACGSLDATTNFGLGPMSPNGGTDVLVMQIASNGSVVRAKQYGDGAIQHATRCAVDSSDDVVVLGAFEGTADFGGGVLTGATSGSFSNTGGANVFIAKLDSSLGYINAVERGAGEANGTTLAIDSSGSILYGGNVRTSIDIGNGTLTSTSGAAGFIGKVTSSLGYTWGKLYEYAFASAIAFDGTGQPLFAGTYSQTVDFGCGAMTTQNNQLSTFFVRLDGTGKCLTKTQANGGTPTGLAFMQGSDWVVAGYFGGTANFPGLPSFTSCNNCYNDGITVRFAP